MNKKVLVVDGSDYYRPFQHIGALTENVSILKTNPESVALVVFTGGEDITPSLYNEEADPRTYNNPRRDDYEKQVFEDAKAAGLPMVGICRGAQFLCAMAGGKLHQHVTGHSGHHEIQTNDGRYIEVTSTHHQMQIPPEGATILAWAEPPLWHGTDCEVECAYYPNINAIGIQGHPEYLQNDHEFVVYCQEIIKQYLLNE